MLPPSIFENEAKKAAEEIAYKAAYAEGKELSKTIRFDAYNFTKCTEDEKAAVRANVQEMAQLLARLEELRASTSALVDEAARRHYQHLYDAA